MRGPLATWGYGISPRGGSIQSSFMLWEFQMFKNQPFEAITSPNVIRRELELIVFSSAMELRAFSWNLGIVSPTSRIGAAKLDRFREVTRTYDITLIQEAQGRIPNTDSFYGVHSKLDEFVFKGQACTTGCYAAVGVPITEAARTYDEQTTYANSDVRSKYMHRTTQRCWLQKGGLTVVFYNHHTRAGAGTYGTADEYRRAAVLSLGRMCKADLASGRADIGVIVGDFNLAPSTLEELLTDFSWKHEVGRPKNNGDCHYASGAVITCVPVQVTQITSELGYGDDGISDSHRALCLRISASTRRPPELAPEVVAKRTDTSYKQFKQYRDELNQIWFSDVERDDRFFYENAPRSWKRYTDPATNQQWWMDAVSGHWFWVYFT